MRALFAIAVFLAACEHGKSPCPTSGCMDSGTIADAQSSACGPSGGCMTGPMCGGLCCGQGERCVAGACVCGTNMMCTNGNTCQAGGPAGGDVCGSICCGNTTPCPIAVAP